MAKDSITPKLTMNVSGCKELADAIVRAGAIPKATLKKMVSEEAKPVKKEIKSKAQSMLQGPYYKGDVAKHVYKGRALVSVKNGARNPITFKGTAHGNRIAEIAFVNEYGKKNQPARPFITEAFKDSMEPAAKAAMNVLEEHMKKNGL